MKNQLLDVLIIGAGQAGLASAYYLQNKDLSYLLIEQNEKIGDSWRQRYDSLRLLTPNKNNSLPGMLIKKPSSFSTKDEYADYLDKYAKRFHFPVELNSNIQRLYLENDCFCAEGKNKKYYAKNVIVAIGAFQKPFIPDISKNTVPDVFQIHAAFYKNPTQVPQGRVLVVGGGVSGAQIALELTTTHKVTLSARRKIIFGNRADSLYRFTAFFLNVKQLRKFTDLLSVKKIHTPQLEELLRNKEMKLKPETVAIKGHKAIFKDGTSDEFDSIIWATGFRLDFSWINIQNAFKNGKVLCEDGVSKQNGLYFVYYEEKEFVFIKDLPERAKNITSHIKRIN